ncbi:2-amino-4-hydroxy-6-hydroxymethyldihydropteridine diphosphokinase [Parasutterella secunda]|uniref:2-amino-4-hydroxy-6-hydroxymethyldihydropteridine pyrophosphokinase n=1 Tax=Parasutterella secunda TaxID=626947 RepID=A0ABS2GXC9_9BURK|nr:2-amino-4-hydroxy-6-hydroxymethyldihydropteridine diphosphokinase [Parasutterella secunda]MBM6929381.1 2-amino-4-hydroxy-6-hydroxymethyldihydropteridine diphosphokinase [Parasutterella secunda]
MESIAFIALGANLGEAKKALSDAIQRIDSQEGICVLNRSSFYKTEPIDSSGPDYVNAVIKVQTKLSPEELLQTLLTIEKEFGRERPVGIHNAPRTMDLDLLLYGNQTSHTDFLTLPHPRMHERAFVLVPLCEIDAEVHIPGKGLAKEFLSAVKDQKIEKIG